MPYLFPAIVLSALTLNFWCLNYLLPAVEMVLFLLGFRAMARENPWFRAGWVLSLLRALCLFPALVLNTTIWFADTSLSYFLALGSSLLLLALLVCLWQGLKALAERTGLPLRTKSAGALVAWDAAVLLLGLLEYQGVFLGWVLLAVYLWLLYRVYQPFRALDDHGYAPPAGRVRLPDRWLGGGLSACLALVLLLGYLLGGSYPMDWQPADPAAHNSVAETKAHLVDLGFPQGVLEDLRPEDIAACEGALAVTVKTEDHPTVTSWTIGAEPPAEELRITSVGVKLPGERETWRIFHHFQWLVNPGFYGTEAIQLWPPSYMGAGWMPPAEPSFTGQVLYDRDGRVYTAPYFFLGNQSYTQTDFFGTQQETAPFAAFSLPKEGENQRGYLAYTTEESEPDYLLSAWVNYTHQKTWAQYPAKTAMAARMAGGWNEERVFVTIQDALQFSPDEVGDE